MNCVYCRQRITRVLSISEILSFRPITPYELCSNCKKKFQFLNRHSLCKGCSRECSDLLCNDCLLWRKKYPNYSFQHTALFHYDNEMRQWFEEYKFRGNYQLRFSFSKELVCFFKKRKDYLIVPIPLSEQRYKERGFNQVEGLLSGAGISYVDCLKRISNDAPQSKKKRQERLSGMQPFGLALSNNQLLEDEKVLLVDDIYTTGRTLFFASEILLQYPLKKLETFSLAR
ncbi:ComF family protein [Enterococcus sp. BWR-S5]|uniref:ComF family protein n=1 Tax=Enterococcus sp. BWR-S5 TaxID=2787714 RepID=UPI0019230361|nr:ComF family protein [Enterococcus sp. BWR-S5]MBL1226948.1 ComF family protein [Enterococcus sp. BWR-S5]